MEYSKLCIERQLLHKTHPFLLKRGKQYSSQCFRNRPSSKQHKQEFHTRTLYTKTKTQTFFLSFLSFQLCSETMIMFKIRIFLVTLCFELLVTCTVLQIKKSFFYKIYAHVSVFRFRGVSYVLRLLPSSAFVAVFAACLGDWDMHGAW